MSGRRRRRSRQMRELKSQLRYGKGELTLGTLASGAQITIGAAPVATGGVDYLVNRVSYSGVMRGTPAVQPFMWAFMKKTDASDSLVDLSVEDDVLDAMAEGKLFHIKGPQAWKDAGATAPRINAKLTDIPMRSGDEVHLYFQNVGSASFTSGMLYNWVGWLSYQV